MRVICQNMFSQTVHCEENCLRNTLTFRGVGVWANTETCRRSVPLCLFMNTAQAELRPTSHPKLKTQTQNYSLHEATEYRGINKDAGNAGFEPLFDHAAVRLELGQVFFTEVSCKRCIRVQALFLVGFPINDPDLS